VFIYIYFHIHMIFQFDSSLIPVDSCRNGRGTVKYCFNILGSNVTFVFLLFSIDLFYVLYECCKDDGICGES
jgi:hypothetical protein